MHLFLCAFVYIFFPIHARLVSLVVDERLYSFVNHDNTDREAKLKVVKAHKRRVNTNIKLPPGVIGRLSSVTLHGHLHFYLSHLCCLDKAFDDRLIIRLKALIEE